MADRLPLPGTEQIAAGIAAYHHGQVDWLPSGVDYLDAGSHRTVYVDYDTDTVYKVGLDVANEMEYRVLTEHAGEESIPPPRTLGAHAPRPDERT